MKTEKTRVSRCLDGFTHDVSYMMATANQYAGSSGPTSRRSLFDCIRVINQKESRAYASDMRRPTNVDETGVIKMVYE